MRRLGRVALLLAACTHASPTTESEGTGLAARGGLQDDAAAVWRDAQQAMGGRGALEAVRVIEADAAITMRDGAGRLRVVSHVDGRLQFDQQLSDGHRNRVELVRQGGEDFVVDGGGRRKLDRRTDSFLRGHEFHMLILAPPRRWTGGERQRDARFDGRACRVLRFIDEWGKPVDVFIDAKSHLPAGFRMVEPGSDDDAPITVTVRDWRPHRGLLLFERLVVEHRGETFDYVFETVRVR